MSDRQVAVVLLGVSGVFYWQSLVIRPPPFAAFEALGAETFPRWVIAVLAAFSLILLARGRGPLLPRVDRAPLALWLARFRLPLLSLALFAAYAVAIPQVGWLPATFVYLVVMQLVLRPPTGRQLAYVVVGSFAFAWALGEIFERFLHVVLPRAALF